MIASDCDNLSLSRPTRKSLCSCSDAGIEIEVNNFLTVLLCSVTTAISDARHAN